METKLLPCPKCGSQNIAARDWWNSLHETKYFAECYDCGCMVGFMADPSGWVGAAFCTEAEAIEAWNARHQETCEGCKYHRQPNDYWCEECSRYYCDFYAPKEDTDAVRDS